MTSVNSKRIALVGCGAVSQQLIVPALTEVRSCTVEWFVDTNLTNAKQASEKYGNGSVTDDYCNIITKVDAAIVSVPNYLHPKVSIDFLKAGRDVLCEKPIANNSENAIEMIRASRQSGARLAVNLVRRRFESYAMARTVLKQGLVGRIKRIQCTEGHSNAWPFKSSYLLRKEKAGGGVLIDWGTHSLDILDWFFGSDWNLVSYRDDGLGRIESNCEIDYLINWNQRPIPCHVELSYLRNLGTKLILEGDLNSLEIDQQDTTGIYLDIGGEKARIGKTLTRSYSSYFADQLKAFIDDPPNDSLAG
jgi:predicted dehydrogenase